MYVALDKSVERKMCCYCDTFLLPGLSCSVHIKKHHKHHRSHNASGSVNTNNSNNNQYHNNRNPNHGNSSNKQAMLSQPVNEVVYVCKVCRHSNRREGTTRRNLAQKRSFQQQQQSTCVYTIIRMDMCGWRNEWRNEKEVREWICVGVCI